MRRSLSSSVLAAFVFVVALDVPAQEGLSAQGDDYMAEIDSASEEYRRVFRGALVDVSQARDEWLKGMMAAHEAAMQEDDSEGAKTIQGCLDEVKSGWPFFETAEHAALVARWSLESPAVERVTGVYLRAIDRANEEVLSARAALVRDISTVQAGVLKGCSKGHLQEANRIQDLMESVVYQRGQDSYGLGAPEGWELLSYGAAEEREFWSPYAKGSKLVKLKIHVKTKHGVKERKVQYDGTLSEAEDRPKLGSFDYFRSGDRLVYEDGAGRPIGVILVGTVAAEISFTAHALAEGTVTVSFLGAEGEPEIEEVAETLPVIPWPIEIDEVRQLKEELESVCAEWGSEWARLPYALLEKLNVAKEARERELQDESEELDSLREESARFTGKETRKSGALKDRIHELEVTIAEGFSELRRVESIYDEVVRPNTRELLRFEAEDFRIESKKPVAAIRTYLKEMERINDASDALVAECVERLDLIRCELMKSDIDDVLLLANRVQATIDLVLVNGLECELPLVDFPRWELSAKAEMLFAKRKDARANRTIKRSLAWLLGHQDLDGKWDSDKFHKHDPPSEKCDGVGQVQHDVGLTALAVSAFAACGSEERTPFGLAMTDGGDWLLSRQDQASGLIGERFGHTYLYCHAMATKALCELYLLTGLQRYKEPSQKAVDFIAKSRNEELAWRYESRPNGDNDTSVTGWMILALKAAESAGLEVDQASYEGARRWIALVTESETGRVGYDSAGSVSARIPGVNDHFTTKKVEAMTAIGLLLRLEMKDLVEEGKRKSDQRSRESHADLLLEALPEWDPDGLLSDMYYWYYGTQAMSKMGGKYWKSWNKAMKKVANNAQRDEGPSAGSFDPVGPWGYAGGRVYSTSLMVSVMALVFL